eukprot:2087490-Pleurochrysis_carterae.AAC.1
MGPHEPVIQIGLESAGPRKSTQLAKRARPADATGASAAVRGTERDVEPPEMRCSERLYSRSCFGSTRVSHQRMAQYDARWNKTLTFFRRQ